MRIIEVEANLLGHVIRATAFHLSPIIVTDYYADFILITESTDLITFPATINVLLSPYFPQHRRRPSILPSSCHLAIASVTNLTTTNERGHTLLSSFDIPLISQSSCHFTIKQFKYIGVWIVYNKFSIADKGIVSLNAADRYKTKSLI